MRENKAANGDYVYLISYRSYIPKSFSSSSLFRDDIGSFSFPRYHVLMIFKMAYSARRSIFISMPYIAEI